MKKYKGMEIYHSLKDGNVIICYSQFDMGAKYKVYKKNEFGKYEYQVAFDSVSFSLDYAKRIFVPGFPSYQEEIKTY